MNESKLGTFEAAALIFTININLSIITLTKHLIDSTGSSALLNCFYIGIISILLILFICKLLNKFPGLDILDISEYLGGKKLKIAVGLFFIVYAVLFLCVSIKIFSDYLQTLYFPETDIFFIISLFILAVCFVCSLKYNAISKTNLLLTPIVFFSIVFLLIADSKYFNYANIFPILGYSANSTFIAGISNLFALSGITCLYLLPSIIKNTKQFKKIALISTSISSLYLILSIATVLLMFNTFTLSNELLPLFSAVRYIEFGVFFQRLDSIFILIWTLSLTCSTGIVTSLALMVLQKITNIKDSKPVIYPFGLIILAMCLIQKAQYISDFLASTVLKYFFWILSIFTCLIILILANIKNKKCNIRRIL